MFRIVSFFLCFAFLLQGAPQKSPTSISQQGPATKKSDSFKPFTGKVVATKVRLRVKPDLDSHILRQVNKNDLLLIIGEEGDFYAVEPSKDTKAYVFRSYILDDKVEADRVNIRLEPHVDAPIIGQLQAGETIKSQICSVNHKWLEIPAPKGTRFYVSKEYIEHAGGADYLASMEKRKGQLDELLNTAFRLAEAECKKPYEEMNPQAAIEKFQTVLRGFSDFPESIQQAKEALALLKETYLNKKISFLETKAELSPIAKEELLAKHRAENSDLFADAPVIVNPDLWHARSVKKRETTPLMRAWDALEESLYLSWTAFHSGKRIDDFYTEQKANASILTGKVETYGEIIKDRPGDYLLQNGSGAPIAYLYSTHVDLSQHVGKNITILASPRPNNHFAFPAYFVLSVE